MSPGAEELGPRLAVAGKGGAGKSVVAGTVARSLARRGRRVLALDSDTLPGLAFSLGAAAPAVPPLNAAVERDERNRWRFIAGVGPARAVQRYATDAPDGVRMLQLGKTGREGQAPYLAATNAFYMVVQGLDAVRSLREWAVIGDLPAGPRQIAFGWAPYARRVLLVVEPTWQSMLTARRVGRIALARRPGAELWLIVNKASAPGDARRVSEFLDLPARCAVPADDAVRSAERAGEALLDHAPGSAAVAALESLAEQLDRSSIGV